MEDAIRQPDVSKSVQRFQLAIDEAKVRLNLAVSPGRWLMPSNLVIDTQSTIGYNNGLKKASADMKLGINNSVNVDTKKVGVKLMSGGPSKINRPTSGPRTSIHRPANKMEKNLSVIEKSEVKKKEDTASVEGHEILKAGVIIGAAISAFIVYRMF